MPTVEIKALGGVRTNVSEERFSPSDLASGVNIDIDETGRTSRRRGTTQLSATAGTSLWGGRGQAFVVQNNTLRRINSNLSTTDLVSGVGARVAYGQLENSVFWTDGAQSGRIDGGTNRQWGTTVPANTMNLSVIPGDLPAGTYGVTLVYLRDGVMESGAPRGKYITLPANSGISVANIPVSNDPSVTLKALYITRPDGELFFRTGVTPNALTSTTVKAEWGDALALRTQFCGPAPAGRIVGFYNGRAYVADGDTLWYSEPYEYELFDLRTNFIRFESTTTIFAPVKDGVFLATDSKTFFLQGADPETFVSTQVANYGGVLGTLAYPDNSKVGKEGTPGDVVMWTSTKGVCFGITGGQFVNMTSERYLMPTARRGSGVYKVRAGTPQYLAAIFA